MLHFKSKSDWETWSEEQRVSLGPDGGIPTWWGNEVGGVWIPCPVFEEPDGTVWIAHGLDEGKVAEIQAYWADWISNGTLSLIEV